jgi:hypothetical protein
MSLPDRTPGSMAEATGGLASARTGGRH